MKAVVGAAPLIVCLLVIITAAPTAANPLWNLDQVGGTYVLVSPEFLERIASFPCHFSLLQWHLSLHCGSTLWIRPGHQ